MTSSFPKSLDTIYGGAEEFAKYVAEITDNKFQIQVFAAGELMLGLEALDVTFNGTVEICEPSPITMWARTQRWRSMPRRRSARCAPAESWWYQGGGQELGNEFFKKFGAIGLPAATPARRWAAGPEADKDRGRSLRTKFRIGGIAGEVLQKVGVGRSSLPAATSIRRWKSDHRRAPMGRAV